MFTPQAGSSCEVRPVTYWVATMPELKQREILMARRDSAEWDLEYGDRHTQFVIIGTELDQEKITRQLDACLINTEEMDQDWRLLHDPYQWKYDKRM